MMSDEVMMVTVDGMEALSLALRAERDNENRESERAAKKKKSKTMKKLSRKRVVCRHLE